MSRREDIEALIDDLLRMDRSPVTWDRDDMVDRVEGFLSIPEARPFLEDDAEPEGEDEWEKEDARGDLSS